MKGETEVTSKKLSKVLTEACKEVFHDFIMYFTKRNLLTGLIMCLTVLPLVIISTIAILIVGLAIFGFLELEMFITLVLWFLALVMLTFPWLIISFSILRKIGNGNADRGIDIIVDILLKKKKR